MSARREIWFARWVWWPTHWKGLVFYLIAIPAFFGFFFLAAPRVFSGSAIERIGAFSAMMIVVAGLNIFIWNRSA